MTYAIDPPAVAAVPVAGTGQLFPVHRVYCVGRNYVEHAKEMGHSGREAPFFFLKPADSVLPVPDGKQVDYPYPGKTAELHHEIELVVAIGKRGANIAAAKAKQHIWGYAVGLDMTRRDLQNESKAKGRPWCTGRGFDLSAPIGPLHSIGETGLLTHSRIWLNVNGEIRQASDISKMIWNVDEIIEHLSTYFELLPGDLIYTGTPEGVGAVSPGDLMEGGCGNLGEIKLRVV